MSGLTFVVTLVDVILFSLSAILCAKVAIRSAEPPLWRIMMGVRSFLAAVFVGMYVWLAVDPASVVGWSEFLRGVGLIAIPLVWVAPPVVILRQGERDRARLKEMIARVNDDP